MKIFVSYSRRDAGDFANQINRHLSSFKYDIFTDVNSIRVGEIWSNTIEENISNCDIFVVIVTDGALYSPHVEREVLQAQKENKKIIPCFLIGINPNRIKWGLEQIQGIEFTNEYHLARNLYSKIDNDTNIPIDKGIGSISKSTSKTIKDVKTDATYAKSNVDKLEQKKEDSQPIPKGRIGALGSGGLSVPSNITDVGKTSNNSNIDKLDQKKDTTQSPPKVTIEDKVQLERSEDIATNTTKKEEKESTAKDSGNKPTQDIFESFSKGSNEKKEPPANKTFHKKKEKHPLIDFKKSPGINLILIIIPIIVVVIIGLIVFISYFNGLSSNSYHFINSWGSTGTDEGQFSFPLYIAVDPSSENLYVSDERNHSIQKFDSNGNFITMWGSEGTGNGQFKSPNGVAVDSSGNVYVADAHNNRIQKFDSNGNFITMWGSEGTKNGQFDFPKGIDVDSSSGNVYVTDLGNHRIQKFDSNGTFLGKWGSEGIEHGQFVYPSDISVDSSSGEVYVLDSNRIQKFNSNGDFITELLSADLLIAMSVDSSGNMYLIKRNNDAVIDDIQKFNSNGDFISQWTTKDTKDETRFQGIYVDSSSGNVYVTDVHNDRIIVFAPNSK